MTPKPRPGPIKYLHESYGSESPPRWLVPVTILLFILVILLALFCPIERPPMDGDSVDAEAIHGS